MAQPPLVKVQKDLGAQPPLRSEFIFGWASSLLATLLYYRFLINEQYLISLLVSSNSLNDFYTQQRVFIQMQVYFVW